MKCLKVNRCKGTSYLCLQERPRPIRVPVFFLATLIMLSMATIDAAQSEMDILAIPEGPPNSQQEDRLLNSYYATGGNDPNWLIDLEHYIRDGCKERLAGLWEWEPWGDLVEITYNEEHKVFLGRVTVPKIMRVEKNHLLFKVYFPNVGVVKLPETMDIRWLREQKQCNGRAFEGTEYSFKPPNKEKTQMKLKLVLDGDRIQYKLEGKAWYLNRVKMDAGWYL